MGRRTLLMIAAVVIAALGAGLIFVYVQGINDRAEASQEPRQVLAATQEIAAGESIDDAAAAGKLELVSFAEKDVLDGALSTTEPIAGQIALTTIFPNEQIVPGKFGAPGSSQKIAIPDKNMAISVQLDDPARVAGFVTPGSRVAVFMTSQGEGSDTEAAGYTRLLLPSVSVIGVGDTTVLSTTTTDESGAATTEEIPKTIMTLSLPEDEAEKTIFASRNATLSFALLTDKSVVHPSKGTTFDNLFQ